jgi:hypothetical protein
MKPQQPINATRTTLEGTAAGVAAVTVFIVAEMITASIFERDAYMPLRRFASVLLGHYAFDGTKSLVVTWGLLVSLMLASAYGTVYGWVNARLPHDAHSDSIRQALFGMFFGAIVWTVNWQILARLFWPWLVRAPLFTELVMHAVFFGMPMAIFYAAMDRSIDRHPTSSWVT